MLFELSVDVVGRCAMRHVFSVAAQVAPGSLLGTGVRTVYPHVTCAPTVRVGTMPSRATVDYADSVEPIVRKTAAWAWRLLVIPAALITLLWVIKRLVIIVVPL